MSLPILRRRRALCASVMTLLVVAAPGAHAAIFSVGGDERCTTSSIQVAIDRAEANPGDDVIRIARSAEYREQALRIHTKQDLEIVGGFADCLQETPDGIHTSISGAGGERRSVISIDAPGSTADITLRMLDIVGGDPVGDDNGGGIWFSTDAGILWLHDVNVLDNHAADGGGVYIRADDGGGRLEIGANVVIAGNTARFDGGGVFAHDAQVEMTQPSSFIAGNVATGVQDGDGDWYGGNGGGVRMYGDGLHRGATFASAGGAIFANEARHGAGLSFALPDDGFGTTFCRAIQRPLQLASPDPARRMQVSSNVASVSGGAIQLDAPRGCSGPVVRTNNVDIVGNRAPVGAIARIDSHASFWSDSGGGELEINVASVWAAPFEPCTDGDCARFSGNRSETPDGTRTDGALIDVDDRNRLVIDAARLEYNDGGALIKARNSVVVVEDALLVDNVLRRPVVDTSGGATTIARTTIANNALDDTHVLALGGRAILRRSIVAQPGTVVLRQTNGSTVAHDIVAHEVVTLAGGDRVVMADPRFVSPGFGDYHLQASSAAVDFAAAEGGMTSDYDGRPRGVDLQQVANRFGPDDLGAYERQPQSAAYRKAATLAAPRGGVGNLVVNPDFAGALGVAGWTTVLPGTIAWDGTIDASGTTGSGSARFRAPDAATGDPHAGLSQCVFLPLGDHDRTFAVDALARSVTLPTLADRVVMIVQYYRNGGASGCQGVSDRTVQVEQFPLGDFTPLGPVQIAVPASHSGPNTSVRITLGAYASPSDGISAWFDRVELRDVTGMTTDEIHASSFEEIVEGPA